MGQRAVIYFSEMGNFFSEDLSKLLLGALKEHYAWA